MWKREEEGGDLGSVRVNAGGGKRRNAARRGCVCGTGIWGGGGGRLGVMVSLDSCFFFCRMYSMKTVLTAGLVGFGGWPREG